MPNNNRSGKMRDTQTAAVFRNPRWAAWEMAQDPVTLLFSLPLLDLSVNPAIYLLSEFHDPWASETSLKPEHINPKHTDVKETPPSLPWPLVEIEDLACEGIIHALVVLWEKKVRSRGKTGWNYKYKDDRENGLLRGRLAWPGPLLPFGQPAVLLLSGSEEVKGHLKGPRSDL